ncbi:unnamed protein product [Cladocopium goreaui]|uniref:Uncharacterized protein n=1 Tax=Cladocopium goreaui TaxID=2562237 RepID=A0A9P1FQS6_9DINO|nr:unnamed protein product [Cladocopium goreaui]|mmetsp:Transcript_31988/g.68984  ORF Transcript_31988/g.68984 Transcript_31988/m.68984 type:complete len:148 (+) Transcript_31988:41-484(+)
MGTAAGTCHCGREVETTCSERIDAQTLYIDHQIRSTYTECACFDVERGAYIDGTFEIPTIPVVSLLHQDSAPLICGLQGRWFLKDGTAVADILDSVVLWDGGGATLLQQTGPSTICIQVEKRLYFGEVDSMAQASISWTDGEKWLKK